MNAVVDNNELKQYMSLQHDFNALCAAVALKNVNPALSVAAICSAVDVSQHRLQLICKRHYGCTLSELFKDTAIKFEIWHRPTISKPVEFFKAEDQLLRAYQNTVMRMHGANIKAEVYGFIDQNGNQQIAITANGNAKGHAKLSMKGNLDIKTLPGYVKVDVTDIPANCLTILCR